MTTLTKTEDAPAPTGPESFLSVRDLRVQFSTEDGIVKAVDGLSFDVERGKTLGIVGESGSGKSVTNLSILGLHNPRTSTIDGEILLDGQELVTATDKELEQLRGNKMAMIFQDPLTALSPYYTVGRQLSEPFMKHRGASKKEAKDRAIQMLEKVGIPQPKVRFDDYPHQFSGGMRQRAMIAMSLMCDPDLLIADEPTTALDVTVQAQILDLIQAQRQDRNMSVILVTHDLGVVAGHTDEIIVMYAGQIVEQAPTPVLFREMRMPYTEALLESIPKLDDPSHTRLRAIAGRPPDLIHPPQGCRFSPRCPYAQKRCVAEAPPLTEAETPGHTFACWYPVGSDVWKATKARLAESGIGHVRAAEESEAGTELAEAATLAVDPIVDAPPAPNVAGGD